MALQLILTDIEGTTSSVSFVHDVLFPYAIQHMDDYLLRHGQAAVVQALLNDAACTVEKETGTRPDLPQAVDHLKRWLRADRKHTALKSLQGLIWEEGYDRGDFISHLYPEVASCLQAWRAAGYALGIYSSGSVHAQRLYFSHTEAGDLTPLFSFFFDTTIGPKKEADSYTRILQHVGLAGSEVLFLSDVEAELDAARATGMRTCQLVRPGTVASHLHHTAADFTQIEPAAV